MDLLVAADAQAKVQEAVFFAVADLLNLEVDLLFFDTTSTYFETEDVGRVPPVRALQGPPPGPAPDRHRPRRHPRGDPGAVLGVARQHQRQLDPARGQGRAARLAARPGRDRRRPRVLLRREPGLPAPRRRALDRRRERMRDGSPDAQAALSRQGRYQTVRDNLRVKEVRLDDEARKRWIVCHNPFEAERDKAQRDAALDGSRPSSTGSVPPANATPKSKHGEEEDRSGGCPPARRVRAARSPVAGALAAPDPVGAAGHRPSQGRRRGTPRRQVPAVHLRPGPVGRGRRARLQEPPRSRTRVPRPQVHPRAAPRVPPHRTPHPRPRPALLARPAAHPRRRTAHRDDLAADRHRARPGPHRHPPSGRPGPSCRPPPSPHVQQGHSWRLRRRPHRPESPTSTPPEQGKHPPHPDLNARGHTPPSTRSSPLPQLTPQIRALRLPTNCVLQPVGRLVVDRRHANGRHQVRPGRRSCDRGS